MKRAVLVVAVWCQPMLVVVIALAAGAVARAARAVVAALAPRAALAVVARVIAAAAAKKEAIVAGCNIEEVSRAQEYAFSLLYQNQGICFSLANVPFCL